MKIHPENVLTEIEKGLGDGPLTLFIACTKCQAQFELNGESIAWAIMLNTPVIEYIRWVQSSKCQACEKDDN